MQKDNAGKFFVGKVSDFAKRKGWFFGDFADEPLLKSDLVEVAYQDVSDKEPSKLDKHLHSQSVEINLVISGQVDLIIAGKNHKVPAGSFYVIWPKTIVENVTALPDTKLVVIRAPAINDKVLL